MREPQDALRDPTVYPLVDEAGVDRQRDPGDGARRVGHQPDHRVDDILRFADCTGSALPMATWACPASRCTHCRMNSLSIIGVRTPAG